MSSIKYNQTRALQLLAQAYEIPLSIKLLSIIESGNSLTVLNLMTTVKELAEASEGEGEGEGEGGIEE